MKPSRIVGSLAAAVGITATVAAVPAVAAPAAPAAIYHCVDMMNNGYCADTKTRVNIRALPQTGSGSAIVDTVPAGTAMDLFCWEPGDGVNGDTIWYSVTIGYWENSPSLDPRGYMSGEYLSTGYDPAPGIARCND